MINDIFFDGELSPKQKEKENEEDGLHFHHVFLYVDVTTFYKY